MAGVHGSWRRFCDDFDFPSGIVGVISQCVLVEGIPHFRSESKLIILYISTWHHRSQQCDAFFRPLTFFLTVFPFELYAMAQNVKVLLYSILPFPN
jgi:hypothetical protein